jgi:hypothetical protein
MSASSEAGPLDSEAMERIAQIGPQHNMYFAPHDVNISAEAIHENATRI